MSRAHERTFINLCIRQVLINPAGISLLDYLIDNMIILLVIIIILFIFGVTVIAIDSNRFVIREYTIESDKINKDRDILFISDLHCKEYGKGNSRLLKAIDSVKADYALVGGDIIVARKGKRQDKGIHFINELRKRMPVYYAYGNHEHRAKIHPASYGDMYKEYEEAVSGDNLVFLDNESVLIDGVNIIGFTMEEPYYLRRFKLDMKPDYIEKMVGKLPKDSFNILLAHDPEYFDTYSETDCDLVLSGHFHGGIARLPILGGVISPRFVLFPAYSGGRYDKSGTTMLVSHGLGMHSIPFRFNNPAELTVIHLKKH